MCLRVFISHGTHTLKIFEQTNSGFGDGEQWSYFDGIDQACPWLGDQYGLAFEAAVSDDGETILEILQVALAGSPASSHLAGEEVQELLCECLFWY